MKKVFKISVFLLCLVLFLWHKNASAEIEKGILTFAEVYPNTDKAQVAMLPLAEYVKKHLSIANIVKADAIVTDNIEEMFSLIIDRNVDIFIDTLHPIIYRACA